MKPAQSPPICVPLPQFVQIEPVGQCNLRCRMCPIAYRNEGQRPAFMPLDTFCRLIEQFPALRELQLQGMGEPFLHPRFLDMVRFAAARGIEVSTNTNLTALSERRAEECVASGLKHLHVSLDAAEPAAYETIRLGSRFERVTRNLERLVQAKRRLGSAEPRITLVAVAMRRNLAQLPKLVRLAHRFDVDAMSVQHLAHDFSEGTLPDQYRPMRAFVDQESLLGEDPALVERVFLEMMATAARLGVELRLPKIQKRRRGCDWPWRGAYVAYSGQAMPCCMIATPDRLNFGDMAKDGVAAVWSNEAYRHFREKLESDEPPEICKGCAIYNGNF
jgi:radical SAM protein with 4Fe4S-binding SPASM domain